MELRFNITEKFLNNLKIENFKKSYVTSDNIKQKTIIKIFKNKEIISGKSFSGNLIKQFVDICSELSERNLFNGVTRELVINAIVHRDYSIDKPNYINIYDDKIEIVSCGDIFGGLSVETIKAGVCQSRNEDIMDIFESLKLANYCGTGISDKLFGLYKDFREKPILEKRYNEYPSLYVELPINEKLKSDKRFNRKIENWKKILCS